MSGRSYLVVIVEACAFADPLAEIAAVSEPAITTAYKNERTNEYRRSMACSFFRSMG